MWAPQLGKSAWLPWLPRPRDATPSLFDFALRLVVEYIEDVESLWGIPDVVKVLCVLCTLCAPCKLLPMLCMLLAW